MRMPNIISNGSTLKHGYNLLSNVHANYKLALANNNAIKRTGREVSRLSSSDPGSSTKGIKLQFLEVSQYHHIRNVRRTRKSKQLYVELE